MQRALIPLSTSIALHAAFALLLAMLALRRPVSPQKPLEIQVVEVPPAEAPKPVPLKVTRAPRAPRATASIRTPPQPREAERAPPPPTEEAKKTEPAPVIITGITMESTSQGGSFAVGTGNTTRGTPQDKASEPEAVKPYKANRYASAAQVTELPRPLNADSINLRKYYPQQALRAGFEGDVVLRLLIDSDGAIAKVEVVSDPGQGLGRAAAEAVRREYRFAPAKVNGVAVATTVPFTVHFTLD